MKLRNILPLSLVGLVAWGCGALALAQPVYADEEEEVPDTMLQISPTSAAITLEAGEVLVDDADECPNSSDGKCILRVQNVGKKPFRYRVYVSPYVVKGEEEFDFSEGASNSYTQLSRWITLRDQSGEFVKEITGEIAPGETNEVYYKIDIPNDIPGGSQYAVIWAQTMSDSNQNVSGIQAVAQAGMIIRGRSTGDVRREGEISDYGFQRFAFGGPLTAKATVKNTGNTDFSIYSFYAAKTIFGKELYTDKKTIEAYPDTEYHVNVNWENTPFIGLFQVEFKVYAGDIDHIESHIVIVMPIFVIILLILLLTTIIVWIIIIIRKRKERKARTIV